MIFFFNDTATTEIYTYLPTLSLHDALPISRDFGRIECIHIDRREIRLIAAASHGMIAFINAAQIERDALFECEQREPALQLEIGDRLRPLEGERAGRQVSRSADIVCPVAGPRRRQPAEILLDLTYDAQRHAE